MITALTVIVTMAVLAAMAVAKVAQWADEAMDEIMNNDSLNKKTE